MLAIHNPPDLIHSKPKSESVTLMIAPLNNDDVWVTDANMPTLELCSRRMVPVQFANQMPLPEVMLADIQTAAMALPMELGSAVVITEESTMTMADWFATSELNITEATAASG